MSKRRSIRKKIDIQVDYPCVATENGTTTPTQDTYFGEKVKSNDDFLLNDDFCISSNSSNSFDNIFNDIDSLGWSKSSGSSTSGSDYLELEATKKVSEEFDKLENILYEERNTKRGQYTEHDQWKKHFTHLRIVGTAIEIPSYVKEFKSDFYEEIIAEHSDIDYNYVNSNINNNENIKDKIKEAVINKVLQDVKFKLSKKSEEAKSSISSLSEPKFTKQKQMKNNLLKEDACSYVPFVKNESFLQISSVPLHSSPLRRPQFEFQSPVMRSHISASKWQRENSFDEYSSLPHIIHSNVPYNSTGSKIIGPSCDSREEDSLTHCSATSRNKSGTSTAKRNPKYCSSPRTKNITLPPIHNLNIEGDKSVSSTPRKYNVRPVSNKYRYSVVRE